MRCRLNLNSLYDTYECGVTLKEDESHEHIHNCAKKYGN